MGPYQLHVPIGNYNGKKVNRWFLRFHVVTSIQRASKCPALAAVLDSNHETSSTTQATTEEDKELEAEVNVAKEFIKDGDTNAYIKKDVSAIDEQDEQNSDEGQNLRPNLRRNSSPFRFLAPRVFGTTNDWFKKEILNTMHDL